MTIPSLEHPSVVGAATITTPTVVRGQFCSLAWLLFGFAVHAVMLLGVACSIAEVCCKKSLLFLVLHGW